SLKAEEFVADVEKLIFCPETNSDRILVECPIISDNWLTLEMAKSIVDW
nr:hypothetical protein [Tanacetum cinerariifolium]